MRRTSAGQLSSRGRSMMSQWSSGSRERESTQSCRTILESSCLHFRRERLGANAWRCAARGVRPSRPCGRVRPCRRLGRSRADRADDDDDRPAADRASGRAASASGHSRAHCVRSHRRWGEGRRAHAVPGGQGGAEGVRATSRARRRRRAQREAGARHARRAGERPEGDSPRACCAARRGRPTRRRGLPGSGAEVRRAARPPRRS